MTGTKIVELTRSCKLTLYTYQTLSPDLELEYVEHATCHCHSDSMASVSIDKEKAIEIIDLLKEAYGL